MTNDKGANHKGMTNDKTELRVKSQQPPAVGRYEVEGLLRTKLRVATDGF
jgi:hypothetical protein